MTGEMTGAEGEEATREAEELGFITEQLRRTVDYRAAVGFNGYLDSVFAGRRGQRVVLSYGRALLIIDGQQANERSVTNRDHKTVNGGQESSGVFRRFGVLETRQTIPESGRELTVAEVCVVCDGPEGFEHSDGQVVETYYPVVNLGEEGLVFLD